MTLLWSASGLSRLVPGGDSLPLVTAGGHRQYLAGTPLAFGKTLRVPWVLAAVSRATDSDCLVPAERNPFHRWPVGLLRLRFSPWGTRQVRGSGRAALGLFSCAISRRNHL